MAKVASATKQLLQMIVEVKALVVVVPLSVVQGYYVLSIVAH